MNLWTLEKLSTFLLSSHFRVLTLSMQKKEFSNHDNTFESLSNHHTGQCRCWKNIYWEKIRCSVAFLSRLNQQNGSNFSSKRWACFHSDSLSLLLLARWLLIECEWMWGSKEKVQSENRKLKNFSLSSAAGIRFIFPSDLIKSEREREWLTTFVLVANEISSKQINCWGGNF